MQISKIANGCHYSVIYLGNQTLAYPFGWRNDRWLQNVLEPQYGEVSFNQIPSGCSPKGCKNQTLQPLTTSELIPPTTDALPIEVCQFCNHMK